MKRLFKVLFIIQWLGWFPFMWIAIYASWHRDTAVIVLLVGVCMQFFSGMSFLSFLHNRAFWMNLKELDVYIEQHKRSTKAYDEATKKLIKKIEEE